MPAAEIDEAMEQASRALYETRYFEAARLARGALDAALAEQDWDRVARICLPLQEARRQIRQLAVDAGHAGAVRVLRDPADPAGEGLALCMPELPEHEAVAIRDRLDREGRPAFLLRVAEIQPEGWVLSGIPDRGPHKLAAPPEDWAEGALPSVEWFEAAAEAIGDAAIKGAKGLPPADRVRRLLGWLDTLPEHEKLHQRLAEAAREAAAEASGPAPA